MTQNQTDTAASLPAHALHGHIVSGLHEDVTYNLPAGARHYPAKEQHNEWWADAKARGAEIEFFGCYGAGDWVAKVDGVSIGRWTCGIFGHGYLMAEV